jgi:hypothetical protein
MKGIMNQFCSVLQQASQEAKRDLQLQLEEQLSEGRAIKDIVSDVKESAAKNSIAEHEVVALVSYHFVHILSEELIILSQF